MADKTIPALKILRGSVGVGTTIPSSTFHVYSDSSTNTIINLQGGSATNKGAYMNFYRGTTNVGAFGTKASLIGGTSNDMMLYSASNDWIFYSTGERMRVQADGKVGIGTNAPGAKIDVNGSAIFRGAAGWAGNDNQACAIYLNTAGRGVMGNFSNYARNLVKANSNYVEVGQNSTLVYGVKFIVGSNAPNGFMFQSNIGGTMTTHMSIRGDTGRVGIGTNAPGDVLHVDGNTIIGDTDRESVVLTLKAQNTAGAPAATTQIRMKGYEGRGIGTFYEDSSYSGQEWFCGMNYSAAFGTWNVGYDASGGQAEYNANTLFRVRYTGRVEMLSYGSGAFTGTAAYKLAVDSSGNIIETAIGAGQVDGSGTANKVTKWTDTDTIGDSQITDNGTSVGINQGSPNAANKLEVSGTVTCSSQLISAQGYTQPPVGTLTIQGPTNGGTTINSDVWGLVIGPQHTRSSTANTYYAGVAFNHLLNHSGSAGYNNAPQAWIGTRLHDTPGSERGFLVFATKSGTGTSSSDVPIERMCIDPVYGSIGIGSTDPAAQLQIGRSQSTSAFTDSFIKLRPSNTTNSTGLTSITLGTSTVDNYGYSISGWRAGTDGSPYLRIQRHSNSATGTDVMVMNNLGNVGINTTSPAYKLDVYGGDARIGTNLRLGNGSAAGNSTNPAITVSGVNTAGVYFENSGVGFGAGSGSKYLFLSSAGNASLGGNGFFKQLGDKPYGTDNLNDYYRSNDEASFCQFYRYDATHGHWANSSGTLTTNAPSTLTQTTSQIYSYGSLLTLRSLNSFRGQFYFAHSASEFYWRSGWGTSSDQNWTRIVGDRNIQTVINNVGTVSIGGASATSGVALSVKGDTEFLDGDTGTRIGLLYDNGTEGILELRDNNVTKVNLRTAGASYFTGGNVGIGTNAPEAALTVADSTAHQAIFKTAQTTSSERAGGGFSSAGSSTATSRYARLFLDADGANFSGTDYFTIEKFGSSGVVKFLQYSNANMSFWVNTSTEALTIWKNGNVGVGTNTPNGLLNVAGNTKIGTAGSPYSGTNVVSLTINGVYPSFALGYTSNRFILTSYSTYTNYETVSNAHHVFSGGNVGIASASPAATLDVKQGTATNNNKLMKVADDVLSVYKVTGLSNHTVTLTCGSYFQAEVVITANQTNGGTYNNLYIRGIWSNNHTSHHWDEIENIGSLTGSSFSITVGQNDVTNSGKLTITHTYSSGSFSQMVVRVTDLYGSAHSYSIT